MFFVGICIVAESLFRVHKGALNFFSCHISFFSRMSQNEFQQLIKALSSQPGFQIGPRLLDAFQPAGACKPTVARKRRHSPVRVETASACVKPRRKRVRQRQLTQQASQEQQQQPTQDTYSQLDNVTTVDDLATLSVKQIEYVCSHRRFPFEDACRVLLGSSNSNDDDDDNKFQHPRCAAALVRSAFPNSTDTHVQQISRAATQQLLDVAKLHGNAVIDGWIVPLLRDQAMKLERMYLDIIQKLLLSQSFSQPLRQKLLKELLQIRPWKKPEISLVAEKLLGTSPLLEIDNSVLQELLHAVRTGLKENPKEKGLMQILLVLIKKYNVDDFVERIEQIAETSEMLLKKSVIALIRNKLKK